ncbi:unnamed protein product [Schistosoma guineensis]|nr:unnamed protein product [Schistosoma guineensis]
MARSTHKCGQPYCLFPVDEGMQCDECNKWFHKMCTRLSPTAYKRCSKPNSHWLCSFCCSSKTLLIQEAISLLVLANKKVDEGCTDNIGTDGEDCVSVVSAITAQARHLPVQPTVKRFPSKRSVSDTSLDVGGHIASAATGDPDKTITVPSCSNVDVSTDGKWMTRKRRRVGKIAKTNDCLLGKSLVDSQTNPPKSHSKASSDIVVSHSPDSQDSVKIKTNRKLPVVKIQDLTSRSKAVNTVSKEAKPIPSLIIWNLEESKDNDPVKRHAHDLQLVESVVRNVLPEEVSGVHITKVIRLGKWVGGETQPRRILKLVLGSLEERDILLKSAQKTRASNIRIRPDWPLEDRIKWKNALTELRTRKLNGENNLTIKGFRVVRSWKPMLPRPVWVERLIAKIP